MILSLNYPYLVLSLPILHFNFYSIFFPANTINDIYYIRKTLNKNLNTIDRLKYRDILYPIFFQSKIHSTFTHNFHNPLLILIILSPPLSNWTKQKFLHLCNGWSASITHDTSIKKKIKIRIIHRERRERAVSPVIWHLHAV